MAAYPGNAGSIVLWPMGLPIMAGFDAAWILTRDCSNASCTEMQCLTPLRPCVCLCSLFNCTRMLKRQLKCKNIAIVFFISQIYSIGAPVYTIYTSMWTPFQISVFGYFSHTRC
jgi:hypothetical protein